MPTPVHAQAAKRLSPELVEVLSMLKALEKQDAPKPAHPTLPVEFSTI